MKVYQDGVRVNVLPECAVCKADEHRRSPMDIDVCPCGYEICTDCYYYGKIGRNNMQELENILEEIKEMLEDNKVFDLNSDGTLDKCIIDVQLAWNDIKDIIRKHMNDGWIPVERELPPNAKHKGAFCPRYQVMTKYGVTDGWYNPDAKGWYVLIWFITERYLESEIDFDRGDNPKVVFLPDEVNSAENILTAWK